MVGQLPPPTHVCILILSADPVLLLTNISGSYNATTDTYSLWCEGSYFPPPQVTWLADGQVITNPRYVEQSVEGVLTLNKQLDLTAFELSDENVNFTCVVSANGTNITDSIQTEYGKYSPLYQ